MSKVFNNKKKKLEKGDCLTPNVIPAFYPKQRFFGVCKDMWNYAESSQTAAHITNCKNVDFKCSLLIACYLNCSNTLHLL